MGGIFISYRREDSAGHAGRLFDRLRERFGKDRVFMDVAGIEPGVDFIEAIDSAVGSCDALIVVIGRKWLSCTDAAGNRRLDDPKDFIRLETATALRREIRVIPVLIQDAAMPTEKDLPEDLLKLARRQAIEISDGHWGSDTEALIETLVKVLPADTQQATAQPTPAPINKSHTPTAVTPDPKKNRLAWLISAMTAVVVALGGLLSSVESVKNTFDGLFSSPENKIETTASSPVLSETVTVPNLIGISRDAAVAQLLRERLRAGAVRSRPADRAPGTVIEQDPAAGVRLSPGSEVHLVLAERPAEPETKPPAEPVAPQKIAVPKLVGLAQEKARAALKKSGLAVGEIREVESRETAPGTVLEQAPPAGQKLLKGSAVALVVAIEPAAPALATVPKLSGLTVAMARKSLARAGLATGTIHRKATSRARPGTVYDQKPAAGQQVKAGTAVELVMAIEATETAPVAAPSGSKVTVIVQGEPTSKQFWGNVKKSAYSRDMSFLYSRILKESASGAIEQTLNTYSERNMRVIEKMLRDPKGLCASTGADLVFAALTQEPYASSDVESAYWPELRQMVIVCSSGRQYERRTFLSPERTDRFPFEKNMTDAMQAFVREHRDLLK